MSRGAVLDEAFIRSIGLSDQLLTLTGAIENRYHALLPDPLFHLSTAEVAETVYLERAYVFAHQISIKASYGKGDRVLAWLHHVVLPASASAPAAAPAAAPGAPPQVKLLMVRELFMLGEWREFRRFKSFVKSMRILDAQSRSWLAEHHREFPAMSDDADAIRRILDCLTSCAEWPDPEDAVSHADSLELLARTYSAGLAPLRRSAQLPRLLLGYAPDQRFRLFRLFSNVQDAEHGSAALLRFISELGQATGDAAVSAATAQPRSGGELAQALSALRAYLLSAQRPEGV
jgi:hypothetical protein